MDRSWGGSIVFGARFPEALDIAVRFHHGQYRKGGKIPYIAHLLNVTGLVVENGADEDVAVAAMLHDTIEDTPESDGNKLVHEIGLRFGRRVLEIVEACTDAPAQDRARLSWSTRKKMYLERLQQEVRPEVFLVTAADKLDNARSLLSALRYSDDLDVWGRFKAGRSGTVCYYTELVSLLRDRAPRPLTVELEMVVGEIRENIGQ